MNSCKQYERYESSEIDPENWLTHLASCGECRLRHEEDEEIMRQARELRQSVSSPELWPRIETKLSDEALLQSQAHRRRRKTMYGLLRLAAILALAIIGGYWWGTLQSGGSTGLLSQSALQRVEKEEQKYEEAIAALEKQSKAHLENIDPDLAGLYRDRLRTIDSQIFRCKTALAVNPANSHIRRYLLAAMQDKRETLQRILEQKSV